MTRTSDSRLRSVHRLLEINFAPRASPDETPVATSVRYKRSDKDLDLVQCRRQLAFQYLVRRYIIQVRFGCTSNHCTTPTCFSCQKRATTSPVRRPTPITARTLAYFLASQDDPVAGLCPNLPAVSQDALEFKDSEIQEMAGRDSHQERSGQTQLAAEDAPPAVTDGLVGCDAQQDVAHVAADKTISFAQPDRQKAISAGSAGDRPTRHPTEQWKLENTQKKKDRKSLSQSLFNTFELKCFEWLDLRHHFALLRPQYQARGGAKRPAASSELTTIPFRIGRKSMDYQSLSQRVAGDIRITAKTLPNGSVQPTTNHVTTSNGDTTADPDSNQRPATSPRNGSHYAGSDNDQFKTRLQRRSTFPGPRGKNPPPKKSSTRADFANYKARVSGLSEVPLPARQSQLPEDPSNTRYGISFGVEDQSGELPSTASPEPKLFSEHVEPEPPTRDSMATGPMPLPGEHSPLTAETMTQLYEAAVISLEANVVESLYDPSRLLTLEITKRKPDEALHKIREALFYSLGNINMLLQSFRKSDGKATSSACGYLQQPLALHRAFRLPWVQETGSLIYDALWHGIEPLFERPSFLQTSRSSRTSQSSRREIDICDGSIPNCYTIDLLNIAIHALIGVVEDEPEFLIEYISRTRAYGSTLPQRATAPFLMIPPGPGLEPEQVRLEPGLWLSIVDALEYDPALRLAERVCRILAARHCQDETTLAVVQNSSDLGSNAVAPNVLNHLIQLQQEVVREDYSEGSSFSPTPRFPQARRSPARVLVEILRTVIHRGWDGKPVVRRWGAVGGALQFLKLMYEHRDELLLAPDVFQTPLLARRLESAEIGFNFLRFCERQHKNTVHILQFPFLLPSRALVSYFRTINFTTMARAYEFASYTGYLVESISLISLSNHSSLDHYLRDKLKPALSRYLVLEVRRDHLLEDAFDQLWRRENRELLRPLKILIGQGKGGEEGVDHGGVSQEFLRLAISRALAPEHSMFIVDSRTHMTWFQPASLEPPHRFELVGMLFSLAIYNGITLPITFPLAFYRRLLGMTAAANVEDIRDGWPELAKGFDDMLSWEDGDVGDVFLRTYEFGFEAYGEKIEVDMEAFEKQKHWPYQERWPKHPDAGWWPHTDYEDVTDPLPKPPLRSLHWRRPGDSNAWHKPGSSSSPQEDSMSYMGQPGEASLVTNANRRRYVKDYIHWLTDRSIRSQFAYFRHGLWACLNPASLKMLTPTALQSLIEGNQFISLAGLRAATRYEDGYTVDHPTMVAFWRVLEQWDHDRLKQLLEFVTASDRVPVNGERSITFCIVRNGPDTELLPTAMTCFGKLLLPEYASEGKLSAKLALAVENCRGFGSA